MSARKLAHDVGKYLARTARNLPAGPVPPVLVDMLQSDLYALDGERRASAVFEELAASMEGEDIDRCRALLGRIDALEPAIARGAEGALREAATLALEVEATLRRLAGADR